MMMHAISSSETCSRKNAEHYKSQHEVDDWEQESNLTQTKQRQCRTC